ncbi:MAG: PilZ domain-containing protein [Firmicutes bacterium]|nr:PilZ domain-containing protein [Bacillota bacterium]
MALPKVDEKIFVAKLSGYGQSPSRIVDRETDWLFFEVPLRVDRMPALALAQGDDVRISYVESDRAYCYFEASIDHLVHLEGALCAAVRAPAEDDVTRVQRREFARMTALVHVRVQRAADEEGSREALQAECMGLDVSGGGMSFFTKHEIDLVPGDEVELSFVLPGEPRESGIVSVRGALVRREQQVSRERVVYSVRFTRLSAADQRRIVQYVFKKQIEFRQRGL